MEILVCRPKSDAATLVDLLSSKNYNATSLPTLKICYKTISEQIHEYSSVIFTSKYAVKGLFKQYLPETFKNRRLYAVGQSTAKLLSSYGLSASYPNTKYNSQELYKLISQNNPSQKSFAIVSGAGGNQFLLKELSRVTRCKKFEVYERVFEDVDLLTARYKEFFLQKNPELIVATSLDVFKSLIRVFAKTSLPVDAIVTITSSKMLEFVNKHGFKNTLELEKINNDYIYNKILEITEASQDVCNKKHSSAK
ncbi:uroporphyrinogen-III synthase [Francisella sp. 19X1-34]|uniref:uroporphyrinogen-III synthase n=1 Tax=Francisella sp. 19X1-34 TaxID=3087177 RepID=UPI002E33329E|nr:uroporphyrinogen-III synthase [Francisella sp. 19X1-34]MED7788471.1 uroporphyrinogen-III synthase [Francisella sp. 19X1-34]